MKVTEIEGLSKYLIGSIPIGIGTTAMCFLMKDGNVIKIYYDEYLKKSMMSKIDFFEGLANDSFVAPLEFLIRNGKCIAQIYPYIKSHTLHNIKKSFTMSDIISGYDKLVIDTKIISYKSFILNDLHDKNILFNGSFNVIDLDKGRISEEIISEKIYLMNLRNINDVILYSLLGVKENEVIEFYDPKLQKIYNECFFEIESFKKLLEQIKYLTNNSVCKNMVKKIGYKKNVNTYYKY